MGNLLAYTEILKAAQLLKDAKLEEGPRMVHVSQWFADKAAEYGVPPQVLFDALMEFDQKDGPLDNQPPKWYNASD